MQAWVFNVSNKKLTLWKISSIFHNFSKLKKKYICTYVFFNLQMLILTSFYLTHQKYICLKGFSQFVMSSACWKGLLNSPQISQAERVYSISHTHCTGWQGLINLSRIRRAERIYSICHIFYRLKGFIRFVTYSTGWKGLLNSLCILPTERVYSICDKSSWLKAFTQFVKRFLLHKFIKGLTKFVIKGKYASNKTIIPKKRKHPKKIF